MSRQELFNKFERAAAAAPAPEDFGGIRLSRLLRMRWKYLNYISAQAGFLPKREVKGRTFWGKELVLPLKDHAALMLYACGILNLDEAPLAKYLMRELPEDAVLYDVGANLGFYSWLALELAPKGEVHAFEPLPGAFRFLKSNAGASPRLILNNAALSDKTGPARFFDSTAGHASSQSSLNPEAAKAGSEVIEVATVTLDDYVKTHKPPTFVKLDVEGWENHVIAGGLEALRRHRPAVAMEIWPAEVGDAFQAQALIALKDAGYEAFAIDREGALWPREIDGRGRLADAPPAEQDKFVGSNFIFKAG